ncbi:hypothetical protein SLS53_000668 [Cytospora paraplurivora]|uniref:Uncharacterized protein n=1 Tax=Cytospora paraplurivora TaxID=2898453 RepID=A0AAN9UKM3_9PEZI
MPRATRSKAPATKPEPAVEVPKTKVPKTKATETKAPEPKGTKPVKEHRQKRQALRQKRYQAAKISLRKKVFQDAIKSAGTAKEKSSLRAAIFRRPTPNSKGTETLAELEALVKKQEEETREQKKKQRVQKAAKAEAAKPEAAKPVKKAAGKVKKSPATPKAKAVKKGTAAPEEVVATTEGEPMQGVEETKVVESVEKDTDHHVIPSIEEIKETIEEETAPASPPGTEDKQVDTSATLQVPRESSAESHAGTPRTLRRSPRKRTKQSLDGN